MADISHESCYYCKLPFWETEPDIEINNRRGHVSCAAACGVDSEGYRLVISELSGLTQGEAVQCRFPALVEAGLIDRPSLEFDEIAISSVRVGRIPIINIRDEFDYHLQLLSLKPFRGRFAPGSRIRPIPTRFLVWLGMPDDFLSLICQRAILGVEAYLPAAVQIAANDAGRFDSTVADAIANPFTLRGRSTVENYYHRLPSLVDRSYSLQAADPLLWTVTKEFYQDVRNGLSHGGRLSDPRAECALAVHQLVGRLYEWVDSWTPRITIKTMNALLSADAQNAREE